MAAASKMHWVRKLGHSKLAPPRSQRAQTQVLRRLPLRGVEGLEERTVPTGFTLQQAVMAYDSAISTLDNINTPSSLVSNGLGLSLPLVNETFDQTLDISGDLLSPFKASLNQTATSWSTLIGEMPINFSIVTPFTVDANDYGIPDANGNLFVLNWTQSWSVANAPMVIDGSSSFASTGFSYITNGGGGLVGFINGTGTVTISLTVGVDVNSQNQLGFFIQPAANVVQATLTGSTGTNGLSGNLSVGDLSSVSVNAVGTVNVAGSLGLQALSADTDGKIRVSDITGSPSSVATGSVNGSVGVNATFSAQISSLPAIQWTGTFTDGITNSQIQPPSGDPLQYPSSATILNDLGGSLFSLGDEIPVLGPLYNSLNQPLPLINKSVAQLTGLDNDLPALPSLPSDLSGLDGSFPLNGGILTVNVTPSTIVQLLNGQQVNLISWQTSGSISLINENITIPIFSLGVPDIASAEIDAVFGVHASMVYNLGFGLDSEGMYFNTGKASNPTLGLSFGVTAGLQGQVEVFGFPFAGIGGNIGFSIQPEVNLTAPPWEADQGKVYLSDLELFGSNPATDLLDAMSAGIQGAFTGEAYASINLWLFSNSWSWGIQVPVFNFHTTPSWPTPAGANGSASGAPIMWPNVKQSGGTLTFVGTSNPDDVSISEGSNDSVTIDWAGANPASETFTGVSQFVFVGGSGNDTLTTAPGFDIPIRAVGGTGTNTFQGGEAQDTLIAGPGNDSITAGSGSALIVGGAGDDTLVAGSGNDTISGGRGNSTIELGGGNDSVFAGSGNDTILPGSGNDTISGGSGNDSITLGSGADTVSAGSGNDTIVGGSGIYTINGGTGSDTIYAGSGGTLNNGDLIYGGTSGDNLIVGSSAGYSTIYGGGPGDTLSGGSGGYDTIYGAAGNDPAAVTNNVIKGGTQGNNQLFGGGGGDQLYGMGGNNTLYAGSGNETLYGGDGLDLQFNATGYLLIDSAGDGLSSGNNLLIAGSGNDLLYGDSSGHNTLQAGQGNDTLYAGTGGDYLNAGSGTDALYGGPGNDTLQVPFTPTRQPQPQDTLYGGAGLNTLILSPPESNSLTNPSDPIVNGNPELPTPIDYEIYFTETSAAANQFSATLSNLDTQAPIGSLTFVLPPDIANVVLQGGSGNNWIQVDPSVTRDVYIYGGPGNNTLMAGSGNDTLVAGTGTSVLYGGAGTDVLYGGDQPSQDVLPTVDSEETLSQKTSQMTGNTTNGGNTITGLSSTSALVKGQIITGPGIPNGTTIYSIVSGTSIVISQAATATASGVTFTFGPNTPEGNDTLIAGGGSDELYAGTGNDVLIGGSVARQIEANGAPGLGLLQNGQYQLIEGAGRDVLAGGSGTDLLIAGPGGPGAVLEAGSGNDTLVADNYGTNVLIGGMGSSLLLGGNLENTIISNSIASQSNTLVGGLGLDTLQAGAGTDYLYASYNAAAWSTAEATAVEVGVHLVPPQIFQGDSLAAQIQSLLELQQTQSGGLTSSQQKSLLSLLQQEFNDLAGEETALNNQVSQLLNELIDSPNPSQNQVVISALETVANQDSAVQSEVQYILNQLLTTLGGASFEADTLIGGTGNDSFYGNVQGATWMGDGSGNDNFYNYNVNDTILGGGGNDTLMFQGDGAITLEQDSLTDHLSTNPEAVDLTIPAQNNGNPMVVGSNVGNITGIKVLGVEVGSENDSITLNFSNADGLSAYVLTGSGNDTIDASNFSAPETLIGGSGSDIIKIGAELATGRLIEDTAGPLELDVYDNNSDPVSALDDVLKVGSYIEPISSFPQFQKLVMIGGDLPNLFSTDGSLPDVVMEGGSGSNTFNVTGGTVSVIGGSGTNNFEIYGGTVSLTGGSGPNTYSILGPGKYTVVGGGPILPSASLASAGVSAPASSGLNLNTTTLNPQPRYGLAATTVGTEAIFAGGNLDSGTLPLANVDMFDSANGQWSTTTLSQARGGLAATSVGSLALFAGGNAGTVNLSTATNRIDIYNSITGQWSEGNLSQARAGLAATTVGDEALFAGGAYYENSSNPWVASDVVDIFDANTNDWTPTTLPDGIALDSMAATSVGDKAIFAGGQSQDGYGYSADVEIYDASTGNWSVITLPIPSGTVGVCGMGATTVGDTAIFAGGTEEENNGVLVYSNLAYIYDFSTGLWSTTTLSQARNSPAATTVGNLAIFAGGYTSSGDSVVSNAVDIYDASTGTWSSATLAQGMDYPAAATVGNEAIFEGSGPNIATFTIPTLVSNITGGATANGATAINYTLTGNTGLPASIQVQYSVNGGPWQLASAAAGGDGTTNLTASGSGTTHTFLWNSLQDLGDTDNPSVQVRLTPSDSTGTGITVDSSPFTVDFGVLNYLYIAFTDTTNDTLTLSQSGQTISFDGSVEGGTGNVIGTATNLTYLVTADGTGDNLINASGVQMPVQLYAGDGPGPDTLIGGAGNDTLIYSGTGSTYDGGGGVDNTLIYSPTDSVNIIAESLPELDKDTYSQNLRAITRIENFWVDGIPHDPYSLNNGTQFFLPVNDVPITNASITGVIASPDSTSVVLTGSFTDPYPNVSAAFEGVTINWGDGTSSTGVVTSSGGGTFTFSGSHIYSTFGSRIISAAIVDPDGSAVSIGYAFTGGLALDASGNLNNYTSATSFTTIDAGVSSFLVRPTDDTVFVLQTNKQIWAFPQTGSKSQADSSDQAMDFGPDGNLYALHTDGSLYVVSSGALAATYLESGVQSIVVDSAGDLYKLYTSGLLDVMLTGSTSWTGVLTNVKSVNATAGVQGVNVLTNSGNDWQFVGTSGTFLAGPHLSLYVAGSATAGQSIPVTLTVLDSFGDPVLGYTGTVQFTDSDSAAVASEGALPTHTFTAADDGSYTFTTTFLTTCTQTLSALDGNGLTANADVRVNAAAASLFSIYSTSVTAGVSASVTVTAYDSFGNVATRFTGTVNLDSTDPNASYPHTLTFTSADQGIQAVNVTFDTAGGQLLIATASSSSTITGSGSIIVIPGPVDLSQSTVTITPENVTEGSTALLTLTARDAYGNVETSGGLSVGFNLGNGPGRGSLSNPAVDNQDGIYNAIFTANSTLGSNTITGTISGQALTSTPAPISIKETSVATLASSPNPSVYGQTITLTATVGSSVSGFGTPTGSVSFLDGSTTIGTGILVGGIATFTTNSLTVGSYSLTAIYGGDSDFLSTQSNVDSQDVTQANTSTHVATNAPNSTAFGNVVTFVATVTAIPPGSGTPTGTVTFDDSNNVVLGTSKLVGGMATFATSSLAIETHSITATYSGDVNFQGNSSTPPLTLTITQAVSSTILQASPPSSVFGQVFTLTATVDAEASAAGVPTGTVSFFDGSNLLGMATLQNGTATFSTSNLSVSLHSITADYSGDNTFLPSNSDALPLPVSADQAGIVLGSSTNPAYYGQSVTFAATVSATAPGSGTPTGTVYLFDGSNLLGSSPLNNGIATFSTSNLSVASHHISASYISDGNFASASSSTLTETVIQDPTRVVPTTSPINSVFGQLLTISATVSATPPGAGTPTGSVSFFDGTTLLGTGILNGAGIATFTTAGLTAGNHTLIASYSGDNNFDQAVGSNVTPVGQSATSVTLVSSENPATYGVAITFSADVFATSPGSGVPTGSVTFYDGTTPLINAALKNGMATYSSSSLAVGSHSITAVYAENPNYSSSVSPVVEQMIESIPLPTVTSVLIDGGAVQRSMVTNISITFNSSVNTILLQNAFSLTRVGLPNGKAGDNATPGTIMVAASINASGYTVATLTFYGVNTEGGSLMDGNWTLNINNNYVQNNGGMMATPYVQTGIKRLFGDINGTGTVDSTDLGIFGTTFGLTSNSPAFIAGFDSDANGVIDSTDLGAFGTRFGLSI